MRFISAATGGYRVYAVSGVNTISFAIDHEDADTRGLLGFAVERVDPLEQERYFMLGFKVFASLLPNPERDAAVSTFEHPVQSFVWDDFTAKPDRRYTYLFHPIKGRPRNLDRGAPPVHIDVRTEPLFSAREHDIFFNRGVASSQAYARRFGNRAPDQLDPRKRQEALAWLSRDLDEAMLRFIAQAGAGDTLLGCFYEFRYQPVAEAFKAAIDRGATVRLIVDAKQQSGTAESFPRTDNLRMLAAVGLPPASITLREARRNDIQHNKFMVLLQGSARQPTQVWTGSANLSTGAIHGQTNVGHWVRNPALAQAFRSYWELLASDPGARLGDDPATVRAKNKAYKQAVESLGTPPASIEAIRPGVSAIFSPRSGLAVLDLYASMLESARQLACITLAFGIGKIFKEKLKDNTPRDAISFFLLEKRDKPNPAASEPFIELNARNNVYQAWGSFLRQPLHRWAKETSARRLGLNQHVSFIHSKFLLIDPLGADPVVVTGSANFSAASTNANDENMLIIRGDQRVADIYFTEFNRLFHHYYFRSVAEALQTANTSEGEANLFLREDDSWLAKYAPGKFRDKRVRILTQMRGVSVS